MLEATKIPGRKESSMGTKSEKVAGEEFSELCMKIIGISMSIRKG